ncbi:molybdopterin-dependent oxidoreductase [Parablastomonas sp. CN1-191]|uniref:molybdopterin-dependent oxidoreductase n=1 Tax=Parablastomonas sp. CN1-191 TaxID=3400908 RepID=UPI003BF8FBCC
MISRRGLIAAAPAGLLLAGCDRLNRSAGWRAMLESGEDLHKGAQRLLGGDALAREFRPDQMSPVFRMNGNTSVADPVYRAHAAQGFAQWALAVDGLVRRPLRLPLSALKAMPQRRQITRHDCVEGWSAIGQWQGPQLAGVLALAGVLPAARYAVFHCADSFGTRPYYESIDLHDALHPQTILAWAMNGAPLSEGHGAPLRLRVERQLGYKHAKFVMRIELADSLARFYGGKGGYWEDAGAYAWYAGI